MRGTISITGSLKYNIKDFGDLVNTVSPVHIKRIRWRLV